LLLLIFFQFILVTKIGELTIGLARTFAPTFGKGEKKTQPDGTVETMKLSGLKGIGHAGVTSEFKNLLFIGIQAVR
jgi:hypothetical protein